MSRYGWFCHIAGMFAGWGGVALATQRWALFAACLAAGSACAVGAGRAAGAR